MNAIGNNRSLCVSEFVTRTGEPPSGGLAPPMGNRFLRDSFLRHLWRACTLCKMIGKLFCQITLANLALANDRFRTRVTLGEYPMRSKSTVVFRLFRIIQKHRVILRVLFHVLRRYLTVVLLNRSVEMCLQRWFHQRFARLFYNIKNYILCQISTHTHISKVENYTYFVGRLIKKSQRLWNLRGDLLSPLRSSFPSNLPFPFPFTSTRKIHDQRLHLCPHSYLHTDNGESRRGTCVTAEIDERNCWLRSNHSIISFTTFSSLHWNKIADFASSLAHVPSPSRGKVK